MTFLPRHELFRIKGRTRRIDGYNYFSGKSSLNSRMVPGIFSFPALSHDHSLFDGKCPHTPRNFNLPCPVQASHFEIELVPGEFRVASHQGLEFTFRGALEEFEESVGNGLLL
jgi:hypothetical protein